MRILPVNHYNYQTQVQNNAQNNKQHDVNFGMFNAKNMVQRFCNAGFEKTEDFITTLLSSRNAFCRMTLRTELEKLLQTARKKGVVMSYVEKATINDLFQRDSVISDVVFLEVIKARIKGAKPVTIMIQSKLTEIERLLEQADQYKMHNWHKESREAIIKASRIKQELYEASAL